MARSLSTTNRISQIPNEVLAIILTNMPDLVTLNSFIAAYPSSEDLYRATYKKVLAGTLRQSESLQIQKLVCTIISIRNCPDITRIQDWASYLDLQDESTSLLIEDIPDPASALQDIVLVTQDIQYFANSFLSPRLRELYALLHPAFRRTPAPRDYNQVRHRFWQLQLLSELFGFRMTDTTSAAHKDSSSNAFRQYPFGCELRKLDRTYDHLHARYDIVKLMNPDAPVEAQLPIIQRLLINMGYGRANISPVVLDQSYYV